VFPYITVNWQMTERLRLINPSRTSPAGPAGLELVYAIDKYWETGLGAAYRSYRFRLEEDGPIPNGIGEYKTVRFCPYAYKFTPGYVSMCGVPLCQQDISRIKMVMAFQYNDTPR
jgi:hypothetical protein